MLDISPRLVRARIPTNVGELQLYLYDVSIWCSW